MSHRINVLEGQLKEISEREQKFRKMYETLKASELLKEFNILVRKNKKLKHHQKHQKYQNQHRKLPQQKSLDFSTYFNKVGIAPSDLDKSFYFWKERNKIAHPEGLPDFSVLDSDMVKLYEKINNFLKVFKNPNPNPRL
jgi:phosphatidate phosphatase PAH1